MKIECYGSRGSIPVSGSQYLKYGGDTSCIRVEASSGHKIILDAGTGIRKLGNGLIKSSDRELSICFTHAHWDHLLGLPFFKPLYSSQFTLNIYGPNLADNRAIASVIEGIFTHPYFPVDMTAIKATMRYISIGLDPFNIGSLCITPIVLNHPDGGVGYRLEEQGKSFVFLTDNELGDIKHNTEFDYSDLVASCFGADLLIHDSEFTPEEYPSKRGWGHSSYDMALKLGLDAKVKVLGLFHHNQDRTDVDVDSIVALSRGLIKQANSAMSCYGIESGYQLAL